MPVRTTITLICSHAYTHADIPTEAERRTDQNPEPAVQCQTCRSPQLIVNTTVTGSR